MATLKLVLKPQFFITSYHALSLITPYHTLSLSWKQNDFHLSTLKLIPRPLISYHILSHFVTPYLTLSPRLETKLFSFGNFKISSQAHNFLHLITPCHSLSHLITPYHTLSSLSWKQNHFQLATLKLVPRPQFCLYLMPCHLSPLITPYYLGWKQDKKIVKK